MEEDILLHGLLCGLVCAAVHEIIDLIKKGLGKWLVKGKR